MDKNIYHLLIRLSNHSYVVKKSNRAEQITNTLVVWLTAYKTVIKGTKQGL